MFLHAVLMELADSADASFHGRVNEYCERIRKECDGVLTYYYGRNDASRSQGLDHAVIAAFTGSDAHDRYQVSPVHQEMKRYMAPLIVRMVVFDGTVPGVAAAAG